VTDESGANEPAVEERRTVESVLDDIEEIDLAIYAAIAGTDTPTLDEPLRRLSNGANFSKIWIGAAGVMALTCGSRGRRAAITGLAAIGVTSAIVNQGFKRLYPRRRPDREGNEVPEERYVEMPDSTSFPSGHSASGFAFATAVAGTCPTVGVALIFLAGTVAYSRVHTGVHYPGDAVVGSFLGLGFGGIVSAVARHVGS